VRATRVDVLSVGIDVKMELKDAGHVVEVQEVFLAVSGLYPLQHGVVDLFQHRQVLLAQVPDGHQALVLEYHQIAGVVAVVFVQTEAPLLTIDEDLLGPAPVSVDDGVDPSVIPRQAFLLHKLNKFRVIVLVRTANKFLHNPPTTYIKSQSHQYFVWRHPDI
jgi:hypothetical protein